MLLAIILIIISLLVITIIGKTYTIKLDNIDYVSNIDELKLQIDNENIVKCIDKKIENGLISYTFESGSEGNDEVMPEATAIRNYLLDQGIKEENILIEDKSKNTFENIRFSNNLILKKTEKAKIAFSTTNYHVFRAGYIATEQNLNIEGIGAKTKRYFWINAFIREFVATLFSEKKKHISIICTILLISTLIIAIIYLNSNI